MENIEDGNCSDTTEAQEPGDENDDNSEPYLYRARIFLPGSAASIKIFKWFPFIFIGRFLPIIDFLSDIGSAG